MCVKSQSYEADEATFETEAKYIRQIPLRKEGTLMESSKIKKGAAVQVWYAQGEEMHDAVVESVTKIGTANVSYVELELEEEVPFLYLFERAAAVDATVDKSKRSSIASSMAESEAQDDSSVAASSIAATSKDVLHVAKGLEKSVENGSPRLSPRTRALRAKQTADGFSKRDLVEVNVGGGDENDEDDGEDQWLPAILESDRTDDGFFEVRMLVVRRKMHVHFCVPGFHAMMFLYVAWVLFVCYKVNDLLTCFFVCEIPVLRGRRGNF